MNEKKKKRLEEGGGGGGGGMRWNEMDWGGLKGEGGMVRRKDVIKWDREGDKEGEEGR